ncbi:MAG: PAS domain-containing hybrid sensor histidine kinase/response regulator, partial [Thermoanaerobaculia bacterium]
RKQEQEALRRSEERVQLAQRAAGIGHFSWDIPNNITTRSDEMSVLYGLPAGSLGGRHENWTERIHPDDLPGVEAEIRKSLISGDLSQYFRVVWPDASVHWLLARGKVLFSEDGKPLRMVGVNMDITERMRTEEELRWKTALLEAQVNATADGILIVDKEGNRIIQNSRLIELWKIPREIADNHDDSQLLEFVRNRARDPEQFIEKVLYLYAHPNETSHDELEFKDGMILDRYSAPVIGKDGTHFGRIWIFRDVTEKKLAGDRLEKAMSDLERINRDLARSEAALREAQRVAEVGHWEWSALTGATIWSDEIYRILDIPIGSVTPSYELLFGIAESKDRRRMEEEIARVLGSRGGPDGNVDMDLPITTPGGATLVLSQRVFADRDAAGNLVGLHGTCQDITRRVATEQALRDSEAALAEGQQIAHIGTWILYPESGEVRASAETFRIYGLDPVPDPPLRYFIDRIHEDDRGRVEAELAASLRTGKQDIEFRIVTPQGIRVAHAVARRREVGEAHPSLIGVTQDITEQKEVEEALRQQTESLERSNADLERFNRAAVGRELRMIELKREIHDLHAELGRDQVGSDGSPAMVAPDGSEPLPSETVLRHTDVEIRESRLAALNMMEDAVSAARALERVNRDLELQIAEAKKSDEAHRRLATVVEQAAETIVITALDGTIVYVNPAFERTSGYSREEALGRNPRFFNSGQQTPDFYKELWSTIIVGRVWQGHFFNRRKDGTIYEEEATISPVRDATGAIINYVSIKRDVTTEVALADQLRHSQKLEAIGTLAGGVAHDFNNLLQAMLSIVQLLGTKSGESSRQAEHLRQLELTIRRGASLTRQLLLFARRETSKREDVDLNQILRDLSEFLRRVVRANILLTIEPANVPLWIEADRGQIEQVIMNLTVNAIDAMSDGGALSIVARREGESAWLEVADTGTGIPEKIRERIFEPFFTTKEAGKGTGLGLSVVHGIIAAHGGHIEVECPEEGGTIFRFELPLRPSADRHAVPQSEEDVPNGHGERVLLVEDEEAAREGLSGLLEMIGYSVVAVGTGEEALGIDETFSVVLTDYMLPGMPGIEVVRKLRERRPDMQAILMSGYAAPNVIEAAVAANELHFLQKPFGMAELARMLRSVLQSPELVC